MLFFYRIEIIVCSKSHLKDNKNHYHLKYHSRKYLTYIMDKFRIILNNHIGDYNEFKRFKNRTKLKRRICWESQANRRYLYFAAKADVEGQMI